MIWRTDARMTYSKQELWPRFQKYYAEFPQLGLSLDLSRMNFSDEFLSAMEPRLQSAFVAMTDLEKGAIANPDENRMVGHYWLRNPAMAPTSEIRKDIEELAVRRLVRNSSPTLWGRRSPTSSQFIFSTIPIRME